MEPARSTTRLTVEGEVERPLAFGFDELAALPDQIEDVGALVPGRAGGAVRLRAVLDAAGAHAQSGWAVLRSADGTFALSVPVEAIAASAVLVYRSGDGPLPREMGGPLRLLIVDAAACGAAGIDACANVKDLGAIRVTAAREPDVGHVHRS
jgi:DMSO/TMAO reductase YedYZ molybdopterin-dependent catalytic subunit